VRIAIAVVAVALLVGTGAGFAAHALRGGSASDGEDVTVSHATLRPGQIVLTLDSHTDRVVSIAQAIVNDAYVDFAAGTPGSGDIAIDYPWIEGQSYEIELLTSTGSSVDFELEDAGEAS
jgi:zinc transporter, ZIP family